LTDTSPVLAIDQALPLASIMEAPFAAWAAVITVLSGEGGDLAGVVVPVEGCVVVPPALLKPVRFPLASLTGV
jgi:hypothetical protein